MGDISKVGKGDSINFEISLSKDNKISFSCPAIAAAPTNVPQDKLPAWMDLSFKKCSNCPLDGVKEKYCFAAQAVETIVRSFGSHVSCEKAELAIKGKDSILGQSLTLDDVLAAVYLTVCVRSKCPLWEQLSILASPLVIDLDPDVVLKRLAQKFKDDKEVRANIKKTIKSIKTVIYYFSRRVSSASEQDANKNAFVRIDTLFLQAELLLDKLSENDLKKMI